MAFEDSFKNIFLRNFRYGLSLFSKVSDGVSNSFLGRNSIDAFFGNIEKPSNRQLKRKKSILKILSKVVAKLHFLERQ